MRRIIRDRAVLFLALAEVLEEGARLVAQRREAARKRQVHGTGNRTLRPGVETPLGNEVLKLLRPQLSKRGAQASLGRVLGLPRQRVHGFVTRGTEMPDAERTLELLAWLTSKQRSQARARATAQKSSSTPARAPARLSRIT